jgi:hypothetical protein
MNRTSRGFKAGLIAACVAIVVVVPAVPAGASAVHFEKESLHAYEGELRHHEVHAVSFHPGSATGHLHISLNNGGHMTVAYAASQQGALVAQARAANARVKVAALPASKTAAVHHKLRYIAGGVLILAILVVLAVLLVGRRRAVAGETQASSGESAST